MAIWLAIALVAAVTVITILRPLFRDEPGMLVSDEADLAVYRDQLAEIDTELDQGLLGASEAEAARAEVSRRILANADAKGGAGGPRAISLLSPFLTPALGIAIPVAAVALYIVVGTPGLPDQPLSARATAPGKQPSITELVAKVEQRLAEHPDDAAGWDVVGPVYMLQQRYQEAAEAFRRAIKLAGETPKRLGGLADASLAASNGIVTDEARAAFERIVALDPKRPEPRYWLAIGKEQDGKLAAAIEDFARLSADPSLEPAARKVIDEHLAALRARLGPAVGGPPFNAAAAAKPGPAPADAAAVAALPDQERAAFIDRMVSGLAERLHKDGKDVAGWTKLMRAYKVLGRVGEANEAFSEARRVLADDPKALAEIDAAAKELGLGS